MFAHVSTPVSADAEGNDTPEANLRCALPLRCDRQGVRRRRGQERAFRPSRCADTKRPRRGAAAGARCGCCDGFARPGAPPTCNPVPKWRLFGLEFGLSNVANWPEADSAIAPNCVSDAEASRRSATVENGRESLTRAGHGYEEEGNAYWRFPSASRAVNEYRLRQLCGSDGLVGSLSHARLNSSRSPSLKSELKWST